MDGWMLREGDYERVVLGVYRGVCLYGWERKGGVFGHRGIGGGEETWVVGY